MSLVHLLPASQSDVTANQTGSDVTEMLTVSWNDTRTSNDGPGLRPISDPNMPLVRFICEVVVCLPIAVFGISGNVLAFVVLQRQKKRLTTSALLQILVVVDSLILISSILLRSMRYVNWQAYGGVHPYIFISLYPCVYFFRLADTWITVLLTVDRYIAVCHPLRAQSLCTLRRTYVIITVIALLTFAFCVPRFFEFKLTESGFVGSGYVHTELVLSRTYTIAYRIALFFVVMYLVPMVLLISLNFKLLHTLRRANRKRSSMLSNDSRKGKRDDANATRSGRSVTLIVIAVVIVCVICNVIAMATHVMWALQMCFVELRYLEMYRRIMANVSNIMITFNCAINVVIYCVCSRKFRLGVKQNFSCVPLRRMADRLRSGGRHSNSTETGNASYTSMIPLPDRTQNAS